MQIKLINLYIVEFYFQIHYFYSKRIIMQKIFVFLIFTLVSFSYFSCTFDSEEELFESVDCDTANVSYSALTYIFTDVCSACHNSFSTYKAGIVMDSYDHVVSSIGTGLVWKAINHEEGLTPMPYQQEKLSDCDLNKINTWIENGMPK